MHESREVGRRAGERITVSVPARMHLVGNPSDGYGGAVVSGVIHEMQATVELEAAPTVRIEGPAPEWPTTASMVGELTRFGHEGGERLVTAAVARLWAEAAPSPERDLPFLLRWSTTIPREVGLGGSSALVLATLRAVATWWGFVPDRDQLAVDALEAETVMLGIPAGIADRTVQAHETTVLTDCTDQFPVVTEIALPSPIALLLAWNERAASPSGRWHEAVRERLRAGEAAAELALDQLGTAAIDGADALAAGDVVRVAQLLDRSLRLREELHELDETQLEAVHALRAKGIAVNFCGSGGAVVALPDTIDVAGAAAVLPDGWRWREVWLR